MLVFIVLFFLFTFIVCKYAMSNNGEDKNLIKMNKSMKKYYKEKYDLDYLKSEHGIKYLGGFKDLGRKEKNISIDLFKDRIRFKFDNDNYRDIKQCDIIDCKIQSETQIRQQVSMGKIVLLGAFALAGNNSKEVHKEYAVLECCYQEEKISIVLEIDFQPSLEQFIRDVNRLKNLNENTILSDFKPYCE